MSSPYNALLLAVQEPLYYDINILKQSYSPLICLLLHYMVTVVGIEPTLLHIFIITPTLPVSFRVQSSTGFEPPYHSNKWVSIKPKMLLNPWSVYKIKYMIALPICFTWSLVVTAGFHTCTHGSRPLHALRILSYVTGCHMLESNQPRIYQIHQNLLM